MVTGRNLSDGAQAWQYTQASPAEVERNWPCLSGVDSEDGAAIVISCRETPSRETIMTLTSLAPDSGRELWQQEVRGEFGYTELEARERIQVQPDGSAALLSGFDDGCEMIVAGADGMQRTRTDDLDADGSTCGYLRWSERRGTYVLDRNGLDGTRLHALR